MGLGTNKNKNAEVLRRFNAGAEFKTVIDREDAQEGAPPLLKFSLKVYLLFKIPGNY